MREKEDGLPASSDVTTRAVQRALRRCWTTAIVGVAAAVAACAGFSGADQGPPSSPQPAQTGSVIGSGRVKAALILPLSASGNVGRVAQSMRNAAEMALAEFGTANVQLLVKDDGGTSPGAQAAAETALAEGAEVILGPYFAAAVASAAQVARARGVPVIAFSNDTSVAARGVYLLSFLPESEVERIIDYAAAQGRRSFAALLSEDAYGSVVEAAFQQAVARKGGRVVGLERYTAGDQMRMQEAIRRLAPALAQADTLMIPDGADAARLVQGLMLGGVNVRRLQIIGTSLWDEPQVLGEPSLQGGWFAAPDPSGYRNFARRYRNRFGQDPVRTATLAYDAVSLVAALIKTQGSQRFSEQVLTSSSGFSGVDGIFRFRPDGTNERGLAVMRVNAGNATVASPAPKVFSGSAT